MKSPSKLFHLSDPIPFANFHLSDHHVDRWINNMPGKPQSVQSFLRALTLCHLMNTKHSTVPRFNTPEAKHNATSFLHQVAIGAILWRRKRKNPFPSIKCPQMGQTTRRSGRDFLQFLKAPSRSSPTDVLPRWHSSCIYSFE